MILILYFNIRGFLGTPLGSYATGYYVVNFESNSMGG